ncbi:hypothetical protein F5888DRAFT_1748420 [Russula emetica]|nr:hypothetical protein F5888DRAFT_1748420 [Russula emetica]
MHSHSFDENPADCGGPVVEFCLLACVARLGTTGCTVTAGKLAACTYIELLLLRSQIRSTEVTDGNGFPVYKISLSLRSSIVSYWTGRRQGCETEWIRAGFKFEGIPEGGVGYRNTGTGKAGMRTWSGYADTYSAVPSPVLRHLCRAVRNVRVRRSINRYDTTQTLSCEPPSCHFISNRPANRTEVDKGGTMFNYCARRPASFVIVFRGCRMIAAGCGLWVVTFYVHRSRIL